MKRQHLALGTIIGTGLALAIGCGGSSSPAPSTMNVHLVDGPIAGYQEVNVNIQTVEISGNSGWITLGTPNKTINLLNLVGGVDESLAAGATLPAGHYQQMRLTLGAGNTVKLSDGTVQPLTVPSGLQTGVKLVVSFDVAAGTTKDVWIDFDAAHSIQLVQTGASGKYILRPTIWAYDKVVTGSISGKLTDASSAAGLSGSTVYAEALDTSGKARIARATTTDANGNYTLDLLPVGTTYFVVSQPVTGSSTVTAYAAKASDGYALTTTSPVFTFNTSFTPATATGTASGDLTPVATIDQSDTVNFLQALATPTSGTQTFIVNITIATVSLSSETYEFSNVPVGTYSLQAVRSTLNLDGTTSTSTSAIQPAVITAGGTVTVGLGL